MSSGEFHEQPGEQHPLDQTKRSPEPIDVIRFGNQLSNVLEQNRRKLQKQSEGKPSDHLQSNDGTSGLAEIGDDVPSVTAWLDRIRSGVYYEQRRKSESGSHIESTLVSPDRPQDQNSATLEELQIQKQKKEEKIVECRNFVIEQKRIALSIKREIINLIKDAKEEVKNKSISLKEDREVLGENEEISGKDGEMSGENEEMLERNKKTGVESAYYNDYVYGAMMSIHKSIADKIGSRENIIEENDSIYFASMDTRLYPLKDKLRKINVKSDSKRKEIIVLKEELKVIEQSIADKKGSAYSKTLQQAGFPGGIESPGYQSGGTSGSNDAGLGSQDPYSQTAPELGSQDRVEMPRPEPGQVSPRQEMGQMDVSEIERKIREQESYIHDLEASIQQINASIIEIAIHPKSIELREQIDSLREEEYEIDESLKNHREGSEEYANLYGRKVSKIIQIGELENERDRYDIFIDNNTEKLGIFRELNKKHKYIKEMLNKAKNNIGLLKKKLDENVRSDQEKGEGSIVHAETSGAGTILELKHVKKISGVGRSQTVPVNPRFERMKQWRMMRLKADIGICSKQQDIVKTSIAEHEKRIASIQEEIGKIEAIEGDIRQLNGDIERNRHLIISSIASSKEILEQRLREASLSLNRLTLEDLNPIVGGRSRLQTLQAELASAQADLQRSQEELDNIGSRFDSLREEQRQLLGLPLE